MVKLYEHPLSPYAQKVKLALFEKSIPFETAIPNLLAASGEVEFAGASPRLEVPSLIDGDTVVFDSTIILEYLEDKWPQHPLLPGSPAERARSRMIEDLCDTYYEAINWAIAEIRVFQRAKGALADELLERAAKQIAGVNGWLERQLGTQPFFNGNDVGWGDVAVYPHVFNATHHGYAPAAGSALATWFERMSTRESAQRCTAAAMESLAGFQDMSSIVESGLFKRQYRDHRLEWMMRSGAHRIVLDGMEKGNIRFSVEFE